VPNLSSQEGMRIWRKMSFALMFMIFVLISVLYIVNGQLQDESKKYDYQRLAILPFVNITQNQGDDYLARGMTRELIEVMSSLPDLKVTPMQNIETYNSSQRLVGKIAKRLNVGSILDGSLSRRNERLYFNFKLIDSNSSTVVWQDEYNIDSHDLLAIQRKVLTQLTRHLKASLKNNERVTHLVLTQPTEIVKAYDTYLRGRDYYYRYRKEDNDIAINLFKQAISIDPSFSSAFAGLADAYSQASFQFGATEDYKTYGYQAAIKAVELNPKSEVAYKALAVTQYINGQISDSIASNLIAVKLNPRFIEATTNLGFLYRESGNLEEALKWSLRTIEIDQNYAPGYLHLAQTYAELGKSDQAELYFKHSLMLKPDYALAKNYYEEYLLSRKKKR